MANFRLVDRDTAYLLPPSVDEWLPEEHLARFVVEMVDELDTSALEDDYTGSGSDAYHPDMMLALLFYSYATGTVSSRKIEAATYDSLAMRYVAANQHPDHDTICTFRRRFLDQVAELFGQLLMMAAHMGLMELGQISFDGSKIGANASKRKALSWDRAAQLEEQMAEEVAELLEEAEEADRQAEGDEQDLPAEIARREKRLAEIRRAKQQLQERAQQRYEAEKDEYEQRMEARRRKEEKTGKKTPGPKPKPPEPEGPEDNDQVNLTDSESRIMLTSQHGWQQCYNAQGIVDMSSHLLLDGEVVQTPSDAGQLVPPPEDPSPLEQMRWRLSTQEGKSFYGRRKATVETVFGIIKEVMGFRRFSLRGLEGASGEWKLVQCAYNLKRMHALLT
ncbi:MAG: transposase [Balneolaceae bacterium]|nr:transposase [Balneolaceae bacterium]